MAKASELVLATDREIRAATTTGARTDFRIRGAAGLHLRVTERGAKSWAVAYKSPSTGRWTKFSIGRYPNVGLNEAKERAQELAVAVRKGKDPIRDKHESAALVSFEDLANRYLEEHGARNARQGLQSRSTTEARRLLGRDILPSLGAIRAEVVSKNHVMQVVEAVAARGSLSVADRVLGLIRAIYNWGCATGRLDRNPTTGLKKRNASRPKTRVLSLTEIRTFWRASEDLPGMSSAIRDALRLQLLTGLRINEITEAARTEIDFKQKLWVIPSHRTKARREHTLPLSDFAISILQSAVLRADLDSQRRARRYRVVVPAPLCIFPKRSVEGLPSRREKLLKWQRRSPGALDPHAPTRALVRRRDDFRLAGIKEPFNTHDLRRTVATQLGEMGVADEIIERILNHAPRTVAAKHYNHAKYLTQMRSALNAWAEQLQTYLGLHKAEANSHRFKKAEGGARAR
jgi:integrase